ncbi:TspO/MBR family domain-containing protein [Trichoderma sp. SZMC 28014]
MTTYIPALTIPSNVFLNPASSILLPIALGTSVGFGTRPSKAQKTYLALKQPPLHPPPWVFGPVWTVLYGLMGYAAYRATWTGLSPFSSPQTIQTTKHSMTVYTIQLGLNLVWMPLFFVAKRPIEATADIIVLLGLNGYLASLWGSIDSVAAWCHAPYLAWLGFATYLSAGAGYLNGWNLADKEETRDDVKQ